MYQDLSLFLRSEILALATTLVLIVSLITPSSSTGAPVCVNPHLLSLEKLPLRKVSSEAENDFETLKQDKEFMLKLCANLRHAGWGGNDDTYISFLERFNRAPKDKDGNIPAKVFSSLKSDYKKAHDRIQCDPKLKLRKGEPIVLTDYPHIGPFCVFEGTPDFSSLAPPGHSIRFVKEPIPGRKPGAVNAIYEVTDANGRRLHFGLARSDISEADKFENSYSVMDIFQLERTKSGDFRTLQSDCVVRMIPEQF